MSEQLKLMDVEGGDVIGCWNCKMADVDGERPKEWKPETHYVAACRAPQRPTPGAYANVYMTEERTDLPVEEYRMYDDPLARLRSEAEQGARGHIKGMRPWGACA